MPSNIRTMATGYLTTRGLVIPTAVLKSRLGPGYNMLLQKLTITYCAKIGPPERVMLYKYAEYNSVHYIHLPRTLLQTLTDNKIITVQVLLPPLHYINVTIGGLFANQQAVIDYLCNNKFTAARIANGRACALLNLRAGMGKTYIAAGVIAALKLRTLYIVPKRPLMTQCVKDLRGILCSQVRVNAYTSGQIDTNNDITVIVINSALDRDPDFYKQYSFVVYDEVHSYCSATRREIFRKTSLAVCLGMTATSEDRSDGFDIIAHKELAFDGITRAENIPGFTYGDEEFQFSCNVRAIIYSGPPEYTKNLQHESTGLLFTHYMHNQFIQDPYRLQLAVDEMIALYDWRGPTGQQHHMYVFAEELSILHTAMQAFARALTARSRNDIVQNMHAHGLEMFTAGITDSKIAAVAASARVLFTTYGYAGTGVSIQKMSAIIFLTPRKACMKQILARIMRRGSDLTIPRIVVDIVDKKTALANQYYTRKAIYSFYEFNLIEQKIPYTHVIL